jgi:hypothetical protein
LIPGFLVRWMRVDADGCGWMKRLAFRKHRGCLTVSQALTGTGNSKAK